MSSQENSSDTGKFFQMFTVSEIILIALISALNIGLNLLVSPGLKLALGHIVAGMLIMVPVDFFFIVISKKLVDKFGTIIIYMTVFGALTLFSTQFGATPHVAKILIGFLIGLVLDLIYIVKNPVLRIVLASIIGSIAWWLILFTLWMLVPQYQVQVTGFSTFLMGGHLNYAGLVDLSQIINMPITTLDINFVLFAIFCGLISSIPIGIASVLGYLVGKSLVKTAVYERFKQMK